MRMNIDNKPLRYRLYQYFWNVIDLIYPPFCGGCDKPGFRWCPDCQSSCEMLGKEICPVCGIPQSENSICLECKTNPPPFNQLRSWGIFDGTLRKAIHKLKYQRDLGIAEILSRYMIIELFSFMWPIDAITSVPTSEARMQRRGYNHASVLALPLSLYSGIPFVPKAIKRKKENSSQVGHSFSERMENVRGAFEASPQIVKGKSILIIDDVITTSATMQACSSALLEAGAVSVFGYSLARTKLRIINKNNMSISNKMGIQ